MDTGAGGCRKAHDWFLSPRSFTGTQRYRIAPERYPGFRIFCVGRHLLTACAVMAAGQFCRPVVCIPGYSGGTAADLHRIPQAPGACITVAYVQKNSQAPCLFGAGRLTFRNASGMWLPVSSAVRRVYRPNHPATIVRSAGTSSTSSMMMSRTSST